MCVSGWKWFDEQSRRDAMDTLYSVLITFSQVAAPLLPMLTEVIHSGLTGDESVHLTDWPDAGQLPADPELVRTMDRVREIASTALSLRADHGLRVRQPLASVTVAGRDTAGVDDFAHLLRDEVNVKEVTFTDDLEAFGSFALKPDGKIVGPKLGADTQDVMKAARAGEWQRNDDGTVTVGHHTLEPGEFELALSAEEGTAAAPLRNNDAVVAVAESELGKHFGCNVERFDARRANGVQGSADFGRVGGIVAHVGFKATDAGRDRPRDFATAVDDESPPPLPLATNAQPGGLLHARILPASDAGMEGKLRHAVLNVRQGRHPYATLAMRD